MEKIIIIIIIKQAIEHTGKSRMRVRISLAKRAVHYRYNLHSLINSYKSLICLKAWPGAACAIYGGKVHAYVDQ